MKRFLYVSSRLTTYVVNITFIFPQQLQDLNHDESSDTQSVDTTISSEIESVVEGGGPEIDDADTSNATPEPMDTTDSSENESIVEDYNQIAHLQTNGQEIDNDDGDPDDPESINEEGPAPVEQEVGGIQNEPFPDSGDNNEPPHFILRGKTIL